MKKILIFTVLAAIAIICTPQTNAALLGTVSKQVTYTRFVPTDGTSIYLDSIWLKLQLTDRPALKYLNPIRLTIENTLDDLEILPPIKLTPVNLKIPSPIGDPVLLIPANSQAWGCNVTIADVGKTFTVNADKIGRAHV